MAKEKYLTTGAFAKVCRTTKETLFHYDREGLLKPKHISENGYRRYGVEQFFDFDMIVMLKETGSSLKEIKHHMHSSKVEDFVTLLEEKTLAVKAERERLARRQSLLETTVALVREALRAPYDVVEVREHEEQWLETFPTTYEHGASLSELVDYFSSYSEYYEEQGREPSPPFGVLITHQDVKEARYKGSYFFSAATQGSPSRTLIKKPRGRYAVLRHTGTEQSHRNAYSGMLRQLAEQGLRIAGNAYIFDLMSYIVVGACEEHVLRHCVHVE